MEAWILWLLAAGVLGIGELHAGGLFLAPFALGAALGALGALAGLALLPTIGLFGAGSLLTFGALRPVARRHRQLGPAMRTGAAALVGHKALVLERIANGDGVGCVKIDGEVWTARALDDDDVIERGEPVEVVEIRGATAVVAR